LSVDRRAALCASPRLKLGALIRITVRRVWVARASGYPYLDFFRQVYRDRRLSLRPARGEAPPVWPRWLDRWPHRLRSPNLAEGFFRHLRTI
jgi:hypothetical protein